MKPLKVCVLSSPGEIEWISQREILGNLQESWKQTAASGVRVHILAHKNISRLLKDKRLQTATHVVFLRSMYPGFRQTVHWLRRVLNPQATFIFHLHGDMTDSGSSFLKIAPALRSSDIFVCSSQAEKKCLDLCFKNASSRVVPFAVTQARRVRRQKNKMSFVYAGRVSAQKNLHALIFSLWLLKKRQVKTAPLLVYGAEDHYGSPNMGLRARGSYLSFLKRMAKELCLEISFRGAVNPKRVSEILAHPGVIFTSLSLHSDENFGICAAQSLVAGNRATLSAWGGHQDFLRSFPRSSSGVRVFASSRGPYISPLEGAHALAKALRTVSKSASLIFEVATVSAHLRRIISDNPAARRLQSSLRNTPLRTRVQSQKKKHFGQAQLRAFWDYADPLAQPFFRAYGMKAPSLRKSLFYLAAPWIHFEKSEVLIRDPRRGFLRLRNRSGQAKVFHPVRGEIFIDTKVARRLSALGYAYPISSKFYREIIQSP